MKSARERGEFGAWLREQRLTRYSNLAAATKALQREKGYGIALSVWAELEAGSRRPSAEQREWLEEFFGPAPSQDTAQAADTAALIEALDRQTRHHVEALDRQTAAFKDLAVALRADREMRLSPEGLREFLRTLLAEGMIAMPEPLDTALASTDEPQPQSAGR